MQSMWKSSLHDRLLRRELGDRSSYSGVKGIYGSSEWIDDLDIVNELGGHTGCVNALSWSKSGRLLASGSDDTYLNIYTYQPDSSCAPFSLTTSVATGHRANIFSVKFMPHSNDRTLVTCAGDAEVRIFDVEYSSRSAVDSARSRRMTEFFTGARFLNTSNTNARVYKCHTDRVKRIVTENSPYLFLTCSEDGEVRQWDLRQPSSAYPAPRGHHGFMHFRPSVDHDDDPNVPPPLISYKRYNIDLNTISCSPSQPHYIALGGAHLHCFLHDRRMMGRDLLAERGQSPGLASSSAGSRDDEIMHRATRCVRRFAPHGQNKMKPRDSGHITACKISDAHPDEIVVSWSGDHIYSFDLIRSPDATERKNEKEDRTFRRGSGSGRVKSRKRKREAASSMMSTDSPQRHPRMRSEDTPSGDAQDLSVRVRYGNGESAEVPLAGDTPAEVLERARNSVLTEAQKLSAEIAKGLVKLRKALFSLEASVREAATAPGNSDMSGYGESFRKAYEYANQILPKMDEVNRNWTYPVDPSPEEVAFQQTLRRNRASARRFVQASGVLAKFLAASLGTPAEADGDTASDLFREIVPAPSENGIIDSKSQFCYDFLKAIHLWLSGGRERLLEGFKLRGNNPHNRQRYPIPDDADDSGIERYLIPYLENLAEASAIVDVDTSRFEHDGSRYIFGTQDAAVRAFARSVQLALEDLGDTAARREEERSEGDGLPIRTAIVSEVQSAMEDVADTTASQTGEEAATTRAVTDSMQLALEDYARRREEDGTSSRTVRALDRRAAQRFWGVRVARGILMHVGEGINFEFVNRAFGGLLGHVEEDDDEEPERVQDDIHPDEEEQSVGHRRSEDEEGSDDDGESEGAIEEGSSYDFGDSDEDEDDGDDDAEGEDDNDDDDDDDDGEEEGFMFGPGTLRNRVREHVEIHVPCVTHENVYRGHCNIKTVKDVNYFGLDDEYVVSGSDSGHVFIWERKTARLVNILEGDSDVVNVVQGHPYEPTLAVSGIDDTIKIFSPEQRAQEDARNGINILNPDHPANLPGARRGSEGDQQPVGLRSCKRMHDSYRITSQNDIDRQGGMHEAIITRSVLNRLAATLRSRRELTGMTGQGGEGATIVLDENCTVM